MVDEDPKTPGEFLKVKQRRLRERFAEIFGVRVHRAISWILRAEKETNDPDAKFIFLWIAFNSAYSTYETPKDLFDSERGKLQKFLKMIAEADSEHGLYNIIWENFPAQIRNLLNNRHVFAPFWHYQNGVEGYDNWEHQFDLSKRAAAKALGNYDTSEVLSQIFSRLYVLRNQLIHGGATWAGGVNRTQVKDGADILSLIVPSIVDVMLENSELEWGEMYYQVVN